ncbi:MAG: hypothetical protein ACXVIJ_06490 [Thermoanaerobaculia bacterium]
MLPQLALILLLQMSDCPMHAQHVHAMEVDQHGDEAMGFSHTLTRHSFRLRKDGGSIEVTANSADDAKSVAAIREHLRSIAKSFAEGDFAKPMATHGRLPDGADVMRERKAAIRYQYDDVPAGGRVKISSDDSQALEAVHQFLKYQIEEHRTGDPITIQP